jgi:hypothetical protein
MPADSRRFDLGNVTAASLSLFLADLIYRILILRRRTFRYVEPDDKTSDTANTDLYYELA